MFVVVDPGKSGGFALKEFDGKETCYPTPDTEMGVITLVDGLYAKRQQEEKVFFYMEKVSGYIGKRIKKKSLTCPYCQNGVTYEVEEADPGSRMFVFGDSNGFVKAAVMSRFRVKPKMLTPQAWQATVGMKRPKGMSKSRWKSMLHARAKNLYPMLRPTLKTCDALLILKAAVMTENNLFAQIADNPEDNLTF